MSIIKKTLNVIAGAADIALSKGILSITNLPDIKFTLIKRSDGLLPSLIEQRQIIDVSYSINNNTEYSFVVSQRINGVLLSQSVKFLSDANATDAEIAKALVDSFNNSIGVGSLRDGGMRRVASGTVTPITFTADARYDNDDKIVGEPLMSITAGENVTVTDNQDDITAALQSGNITNAAPRVVTATAHGLVTGSTIVIALATGAGAADVNKTHRVTFLTANTFELDGTTATGTVVVGSATGIEVAQRSRGAIGDLKADGILASDISASVAYSQVDFRFAREAQSLMGAKRDINELRARLYVSAHSTITPFAPTSNFAAFETELTANLDGSGVTLAELHALV